MHGDMIINKLKLRIWWYIYFGVQFLLVIFMIGGLGSEKWVTSLFHACKSDNYDDYYYSASCGIFEGSLSTCKNGCDDTYAKEFETFCNKNDDNDPYNNINDNIKDSHCKMYAGLYFGSAVLIVFEMITFISLIVWCLAMILILRRKNCFILSCCCSVNSCVGHFIGMISWFGLSKANFKDDCGLLPIDGSQPTLCAKDGPGLGVFLMVLFPIVVGYYLHVGYSAYYKRNDIQQAVPVTDQQIINVHDNNVGASQVTDVNFQNGPFVPMPLSRNDGSLGNSSKKKSNQKGVDQSRENSSRDMLANIPLYYDVDDLGKYAAFQLVPYPHHK